MILTYSRDQFVDAIKDGTKIHTIRADPQRRWRTGMNIQHWRGNGSCQQISQNGAVASSTSPIFAINQPTPKTTILHNFHTISNHPSQCPTKQTPSNAATRLPNFLPTCAPTKKPSSNHRPVAPSAPKRSKTPSGWKRNSTSF